MTIHNLPPQFPPGQIAMIPISELRLNSRNPRTHSEKQIRKLVSSVREFGWTNPVIADEANLVLAGHGRIEAAKRLNLTEVPVIRIGHMSEAQKRAYVIADNRLAEDAGWDHGLLGIEFAALIDLGFEVALTGFEISEIDIMMLGEGESPEPRVDLPEPDAVAVNRPGDAWSVGPHRLVCGSALVPDAYGVLLGRKSAQMVFTDPPYNVQVDGHVTGLGRTRHREFAMASGEMTEAEFTEFLAKAYALMAEASVDGAIHFICMDWRHMPEMLAAGHKVYSELKNLCVWGKTNAGMGSFYRSQHELVFAWKKGTAAHINNFGLGEKGRHRSNLWTYAGANTFRAGRMEDLAAHPTVKPVAMVRDAILDCSDRGAIVMDPFAGSGTTLLAAAEAGRAGAGIELDPLYADLIIRRLQEATGEIAVHDDTFECFEVMAQMRSSEE
jgi:DNA modification methylase